MKADRPVSSSRRYIKIQLLFLVIADAVYGPCWVAVYEPGEESVVPGVQKKTPADIRTNVIHISSPIDSWQFSKGKMRVQISQVKVVPPAKVVVSIIDVEQRNDLLSDLSTGLAQVIEMRF
jgi:hypothetical protein